MDLGIRCEVERVEMEWDGMIGKVVILWTR